MNSIFNTFESLGVQAGQTFSEAASGDGDNGIQVKSAFPGHPVVSSQNYFRGDTAHTGRVIGASVAPACPVIKYETGFRRRGLPWDTEEHRPRRPHTVRGI